MFRRATVIFISIIMLSFSVAAYALSDPIIFPKDGQSKEQTTQDKAFCRTWAEEETGVDPSVVKMQWEMAREKVVGEEETGFKGLFGGILKGAATGAVTGAIEANVDNEVGSDALKGAVLGGVLTHEKREDKNEERQYRLENLSKEDLEEAYNNYVRAFSVCMEVKGYSIK